MEDATSIYTTLPEIKKRSLIENNLAWAFLTNIPITPGHTLIAPKRVVANIHDLTRDELLDIFSLVENIKAMLQKAYGAKGFNCTWNEGKDFGQSVPHFHLHIVPRTEGDEGIMEYEPRKFLYRPGSREDSPEDELQAVANELRQYIV